MTHFKARNLTALLLVLILLVSMFSTTALAAEDEYITDFEAESEIIIEGEPTEELPEAEESSEEVPEIEESSEVSDAPTSGTIPGSNIQWELTDDGMLLISGNGGCAASCCAIAACRSSAAFSTGGSSLPRTEALRRIPRHAFGLK